MQYPANIYRTLKKDIMDTQIYRTTGEPLGFIRNNNLYDIHGKALGWSQDMFVYNKNGLFCGRLFYLGGANYIIKFLLDLSPLPQLSREIMDLSPLEVPPVPTNRLKIELPPGYSDGF